jgi:hypothetical protein
MASLVGADAIDVIEGNFLCDILWEYTGKFFAKPNTIGFSLSRKLLTSREYVCSEQDIPGSRVVGVRSHRFIMVLLLPAILVALMPVLLPVLLPALLMVVLLQLLLQRSIASPRLNSTVKSSLTSSFS